MTTEVYGTDIRYRLRCENDEITVIFGGTSDRGVIEIWQEMKPSFAWQLEILLENSPARRVCFSGSGFGARIFRLLRYELRDLLKGKTVEEYKTEESTMKIYRLDNTIICGRYSEECDEGLSIALDAPLDTEFRCKRSDGAVYAAAFKDGVVKIPADFLTDGHYMLCAVRGGVPTNTVNMQVETGRCGRRASCRMREDDLLDAVEKLAASLCHTQEKVSAHMDGYDVI